MSTESSEPTEPTQDAEVSDEDLSEASGGKQGEDFRTLSKPHQAGEEKVG